jgi:large subunit ribosomal protein L24
MTKIKIKKGDMVQVIAGDAKNQKGKVLAVYPKKDSLIVEGCKMIKKSVKKSDKNPDGGFISKEVPIHISNVKKVDDE